MSDENTTGGQMKPAAMQVGTDVLVRLRDGRLITIQTDTDNEPPATGGNSPAVPSGAPARATWAGVIGGILNFVALTARITALTIAATLLKEQLHLLKARMHRDAQKARTLSEHLHQAGADGRFQAQALEVAAAFERVAQASAEVANTADQMEMNAQMVKDAHQAEYGGVYEVRQASPYEQPKPGFNRVR